MRMRNHTEHRLKSVAVIALYGNQRAEMESIMNKSTSSIDRIQDPAVARETVPGRLFDSKLLSEDAVRRKMRLNPFTHHFFRHRDRQL